jgi:hypothetical protein
LPIFDCKGIKTKCRMSILRIDIRPMCVCSNGRSCVHVPKTRAYFSFVSVLRQVPPNTPLTRP